jgi:nitrate reductase molybdenum cofactor assembly chaperone NarJ/NarW
MNTRQCAVAARAVSLLLRYPDGDTLAAVPTILVALGGLPAAVGGELRHVADHRRGADRTALAGEYVQLFDFRRRCCLHLTYYTCGDTRNRGEALVRFASAYRQAGLSVADGELPDYLPAVLDLAAADEAGWRLLREHRVGLDLLAAALAREGSVYRHAVDALRALLPAAGPGDLEAASRLAREGPPREMVGLEGFAPARASGGRR